EGLFEVARKRWHVWSRVNALYGPGVPASPPSSFLFHHALERMLVFAGKVHHLRHLGLGHLVGVDPALADSMLVHVHHDPMGGFVVLVEEALKHMHDELHRRVVVVEQQHAVEVGALGLRPGLGDDRRARRARSALAVVLVGEARRERHAPGVGMGFGWSSAHDDFADIEALRRLYANYLPTS